MIANFEVFVKRIPRMRSELLQTESNTLLLIIKVKDNNIEFLTDFNEIMGIVNATPGKICDMYETVNTTQVNEYAVRGNILNNTLEYLTFLEFADDFFLLGFEFCLDKCLM